MIDLQKSKDSDIGLNPDHYLRFMLFLLKNAHSEDIDKKLEYMHSTIQFLQKEDIGLRFVGYGLYYIMTLSEDLDKKTKLTDFFVKDVSEEKRGKIMRIIDHVKEEGIAIGIEKGIEKTALNMLKKNISTDIVEIATKLSPSKIEELKKKLH